MTLSAGDWVEVRSKEDILATLDANGRLEGLPFMPQMFKWCGQRFPVYKRAHKTCDTVTGYNTGEWLGRSLPNAVHLELRCDGEAYGGCQAACLIFWKEAWLTPVDPAKSASASRDDAAAGQASGGCTARAVWDATKSPDQVPGKAPRYACQATELPTYTQPLKWWDARQYAEDITSGNVSVGKMFRGLLYFAYVGSTMARRPRLGRPARWIYDRVQSLWGGVPFPRKRGDLATDKDAPIADLGLQPGDLVRVRPHKDILATIDKQTNNRGMGFDAEMARFIGRTARVLRRVDHIIDEHTGRMIYMKSPCLVLEGVICEGAFNANCPRAITPYWREIWLEKVEA
jgi:hypothetical protein